VDGTATAIQLLAWLAIIPILGTIASRFIVETRDRPIDALS